MSRVTRLALTALVAGTALALMVGTPASAAAAQWVVAADIGSTRAATGEGTRWWAETTNGGSFSDGAAPFDGAALMLRDPAANSSVRVLNTYAPDAAKPTIAEIVNGASYTFAGTNVNFQIEIFFTPVDPAYGPDTTNTNPTRCTAANQTTNPGQCYTVLKWEPLTPTTPTPTEWTTAVLTDAALGNAPASAGWIATNRVGIYPRPTAQAGFTLTQYLAQMTTSSVVLLGVGASIGSGTADATGSLQSLTYAGTTTNFRAQPPAPPAAPASDPALPDTGSASPLPLLAISAAMIGFGLLVVRSRKQNRA